MEQPLNHIHTTATAAEKLKRLAKTLRKETRTSLAVAQDAVAREGGYLSWKHVTVCAERTRTEQQVLPPLPTLLADTLASEALRSPPDEQSFRAFASGLVFAMDVKDADGLDLGKDVVECDDGWTIAAADIWRVYVHYREETRSLAETMEPEKLLEAAHGDFMNYRLFRYTGVDVPEDLNTAFALVLGRYFFPPRHVWLKGRFIDMAEVKEVRVNGRVVIRNNLSMEEIRKLTASSRAASVMLKASHRHDRNLVGRLDVREMLEPGLYEMRMSFQGQEVFSDAGFESIQSAIESVSLNDGPIYAVEFAYQGLVIGTYSPAALEGQADAIAERAVAMVSALHDH